jgi:hypothetical protein
MTDSDQPRCECDTWASANPPFSDLYSYEEGKSWGHEPGKCLSRSHLQRYTRGARVLWLCSACVLRSDEPITESVNA